MNHIANKCKGRINSLMIRWNSTLYALSLLLVVPVVISEAHAGLTRYATSICYSYTYLCIVNQSINDSSSALLYIFFQQNTY